MNNPCRRHFCKKTAIPPFAVVQQLIALREQRGLSQRDLADWAGIKQPHLAHLETGQVEPKRDTLRCLAAAMGCRIRVSFEPTEKQMAATPGG